MTPEEARDAKISEIHAAGGVVGQIIPLAQPDSPHVVSGYRVQVCNPLPGVLDLSGLVTDSLDGQIEWTPEEVPDAGSTSGTVTQ